MFRGTALRELQEVSNEKIKAYRKKLENVVFDLLQEIETCNDDVFCRGFAAGRATSARNSLKKDINETLSKELTNLTNIHKEIAVCETYKIPEFIEISNNIVASVENCLNKEN